jgi:hypothetical protein
MSHESTHLITKPGFYRYEPDVSYPARPALEERDDEVRALRVALAKALVAICYNAGEGDGFTGDEDIHALHAACPLLGIDLTMTVEEPESTIFKGDAVYHLEPSAADVLAALEGKAV